MCPLSVCVCPAAFKLSRRIHIYCPCPDRVALRVVCHKLSSNLIGVPHPLSPQLAPLVFAPLKERRGKTMPSCLFSFFFFVFSCFLHFPASTKRAFLCVSAHSISHAHFHYFYHFQFQFQLVDQLLLCEPLK